jgi:hypothetical protein
LAGVVCQQNGDLIKAEGIARESLRIKNLIYDSNHCTVDLSCNLLARILSAQGKFGDETRGLYERSLAISIRNEGPDGLNVAIGNYSTSKFNERLVVKQSTFDAKRSHLLLAKSRFFEAQRIYSKIYGPTHTNTVDAASRLNVIIRILSRP